MMSLRFAPLFAIALLLVSVAQPGQGKRKGKGPKPGSREDADHEELKAKLESLKLRIEHLEAVDHGDGDDGHPHAQPLNVIIHTHHEETEEVEGPVINLHLDLDHGGHHHGSHSHGSSHGSHESHSHEDDEDHVHQAHCQFHGEDDTIDGFVHIRQEGHKSSLHVMFESLSTVQGDYTLHVHQFGDKSDGCLSLGDHFSTDGGDGIIGVVSPDVDGKAHAEFNETGYLLDGHHKIIGHSIMIHDTAGDGLACCVIGWSHEMDQAGHHGHHAAHAVHAGAHAAHAAHAAHGPKLPED